MSTKPPYWDPNTAALRDITREQTVTVDELRRLRIQLDMAIKMIDANELVWMSESERMKHKSQFGPDTILVGDFVIKRRW